jgi:MarR family 2-MHQ and catechol resistance regulon transcriptional repressor
MGTHYKGNKKEVNSLNAFLKLIRAAGSVSTRINSILEDSKLTESQFNILDALHHLGPLSQKQLGDKLFRSGGNITMVVDNLEKQELVKRVRGEKDRRYFAIHLTKNGKALIERIFPRYLSAVVNEMDVLAENELLELERLCKKLGLKIEKKE